MKPEALLVGIDLGTTNIKAIVFDPTGAIVASASVPTPTVYPRPTWAYHDPNEFWAKTAQAIHQVVSQLEDPRRIVSVAVTSTGETGFPLDKHGEATYESIAWFDGRTKAEAQWLDAKIGADRLFATTGLSLQPIFSLCKILWLRKTRARGLRPHGALAQRRRLHCLSTLRHTRHRPLARLAHVDAQPARAALGYRTAGRGRHSA